MVGITDDQVAQLKASGLFDEDWYCKEYPDVVMTGISPAHHYLWLGQRLGRRPSAHAGGGATPIQTYAALAASKDEATATPSSNKRSGWRGKRRSSRDIDPHVREVVEREFDVDYYLTKYPDIEKAGVDPIEHYLSAGWKEGRDPSLSFSTDYYAQNNPDVMAAGVNPFFHFVASGRNEGREGRHGLGFRYEILAKLRPVAEQIEETKRHRVPVHCEQRPRLVEALSRGQHASKFIVSFSHDDYTKHVGGVQMLLRREANLLRENQWLHLHLFPAYPLQFIETSADRIPLGAIVNGKWIGFFDPSDVSYALASTQVATFKQRRFVIHSLLGHNVAHTLEIIQAAEARRGYLWLHDYSPIYNNYKLLRNDVEYKGIPRRGTWAWSLCAFAQADFSQPEEFAKIFAGLEVEVIAPSHVALDIFKEASLFSAAKSHVIEHCVLNPVKTVEPTSQPSGRRLKVGFLGYPADHKGWSVFQELVLAFADDTRYEFFHLGRERRGGLPVAYREVTATGGTPDAMRLAVAAVELDVALVWSIWPETFCLVAYEALAGGAAIVTGPDSGNVARLATSGQNGAVLPSEAALKDYFKTGEVANLARSHRKVALSTLEYSDLTVTLLEEHS